MSSYIRNFAFGTTFLVASAFFLFAQDASPEAERYALHDKAVAAQERGDLLAAKKAYEQLLLMNEKDIGAREGLATIEAELAAAEKAAQPAPVVKPEVRSEEHTSELQSQR